MTTTSALLLLGIYLFDGQAHEVASGRGGGCDNECFLMMKAYKLVRKLKNGQLAPLFINKKARLPLNEWLLAEVHETKGYAVRSGWHCVLSPQAPHLSTKDRVWVEVLVKNYEFFTRPEKQGGTWVLAKEMMILREL